MQNGVFVASEILAKHDESYMPAEVIDALKAQGGYKEPETFPRAPASPAVNRQPPAFP